jgi:DNA-binding MarR family transcriptional regulator
MTGSETATATRLSATEKSPRGAAWWALARTHAAISQRLQDSLAQEDFPPLPWYEVLATIAKTPEGRMRMGELAEMLVITRGGLTKLIDRLVKAGLLERTFCDSDRRVSYATLLPAGIEMLDEMRPLVEGEIEASFSSKLSVDEAHDLRETLDALRAVTCGSAE